MDKRKKNSAIPEPFVYTVFMSRNIRQIHDRARKENIPVMMDDGIEFILSFLEKNENIRDILECGTAVGYSAIRMASVRWDMRVDTLEISRDMYEQAVDNIIDSGLQNRITCYLCDAAEFETDRIYDMIFIDAAKSQYRRYLEHFMKNSREGTVFIFDNLAFHGIVDDNSLSRNRSTVQMAHKIRRFREHLLNDDRFDTQYYENTGDGIAVARRIK